MAHAQLLDAFLAQQLEPNDASRALRQVFRDLAAAAVRIRFALGQGGLVDVMGASGITNVQGETQMAMDDLADQWLMEALKLGGATALAASEERDEAVPLNPTTGRYVVNLDPLDGSSNLDVAMPVGTIFSVLERINAQTVGPQDCLQPGRRLAAAGYILFGSSTQLVFTVGQGVHRFALDATTASFHLLDAKLSMPERAALFSINTANRPQLAPALQQYLDDVDQRAAQGSIKPRYVGSLVADFHRNLLKGGIFLYPGTVDKPLGKLRLLYEAIPMAWLAEQAGGWASNGQQDILDMVPQELHQRTPLYVGSADEMTTLNRFLSNSKA